MEEKKIDVLMNSLESAAIEASADFPEFLKRKYGDKPETVFMCCMIFFEYLYFFLHQVNRAAFATLVASDCQRLFRYIMPRLVERNFKELFRSTNKDNKDNLEPFMQEYNNAEMEYARSNVLVNPPGKKGADMLSSLFFRIIEIINNQEGLKVEEYSEILPITTDRLIEQMKNYFSNGKMERFLKDIEIPE